MAVYTDVAAEDLAEFLKSYDIGELLSYKGIAEGVENSNFLMHTSKGAYILTLYEKRVAEDDLPYFLSLMAHLAGHGVVCPQPARNRSGAVFSTLAGRPVATTVAPSRSSHSPPSVATTSSCLSKGGGARSVTSAPPGMCRASRPQTYPPFPELAGPQ